MPYNITKDMSLNDLINLPELSEIKDMWIPCEGS